MPSRSVILSANNWDNNAELIADVAKLGYVASSDITLDMTYGAGAWWKVWKPFWLEAFSGNFMYLPYEDEIFDLVAYDPPYVSIGGRQTSTIVEMHRRYGNLITPRSPKGLQDDVINPGLLEGMRVAKPKGIILVKVMDYISSGKLWPGVYWTLNFAFAQGCTLIDRFIMINNGRPQRAEQVHARSNYSVLLVLRNPGS